MRLALDPHLLTGETQFTIASTSIPIPQSCDRDLDELTLCIPHIHLLRCACVHTSSFFGDACVNSPSA